METQLLELVKSLPALLAIGLLLVLGLRSPAGLIITKKLFNGQTANGDSKRDLAGEASVSFWETKHREITEEVMRAHEQGVIHRFNVQTERYNDLRDSIKELAGLHRETIQAIDRGNDRIVSALLGRGGGR